jgi:hypothetical protein
MSAVRAGSLRRRRQGGAFVGLLRWRRGRGNVEIGKTGSNANAGNSDNRREMRSETSVRLNLCGCRLVLKAPT